MNYSDAIKYLYDFRQNNIIIALTGRTGSGCSTVANLLKCKQFKDLPFPRTVTGVASDYLSREKQLENDIIYNYMCSDNHWYNFEVIEVSAIILSFVLERGKNDFINYFKGIINNTTRQSDISIGNIDGIITIINNNTKYFDDINDNELDRALESDVLTQQNCLNFYLKELPDFKQAIKSDFDKIYCYKTTRTAAGVQTSKLNLYTFIMQNLGNNLRASGNYYTEQESSLFSNVIVERIDKIITLIKQTNARTRVCIDSLRNPMEILYFRDRYKCFYTFSINVEETNRRKRLNHLSEEELTNLDMVEYPKQYEKENEFFFHQDMQKCIELADVHINNSDIGNSRYFFLTSQLAKYIALILHPGLVVPSKEERCMQIAYNARLNSGCLSRQVGAVITSKDYSIKAVGWNDTPSEQTPCNLRTVDSFCETKSGFFFSDYELSNVDFNRALEVIKDKREEENLKCGIPYCYCFKDVYNAIEKNKNQVHTRSLHAEENAFLQISKDGGMGIKGGKLFVTASPCELCSKKSFQLGIEDIYYIDPYPGIAQQNILNFGMGSKPRVHLFNGVVGEKYIELYLQRIARKDELAFLYGFENKKVISEMYVPKTKELKFSDIEYELVNINFKFNSRSEIICKTKYTFVPRINNIQDMEFIVSWTGSNFDDIKCEKYHVMKIETGNKTLHKYRMCFNEPLPINEKCEYEIETHVRDLNIAMLPYITNKIKYLTKKLVITLEYDARENFIDKNTIISTQYADFNMEQLLAKKSLNPETADNCNRCTYVVEEPILNYCYGIEWKFKKTT